jgi:hypothetical protein
MLGITEGAAAVEPAPMTAGPASASDRAGTIFPASSSVAASAKPSEPPLPPGQVWQCTIDGQKTFSDKRCGAAASVRQLNEVNRMDPTPESNIHFYGAGAPAHSPGTDIASGAEIGAAPAGADEIYGSPPLIVVRGRPGHRPVPRSHPHGHGHK